MYVRGAARARSLDGLRGAACHPSIDRTPASGVGLSSQKTNNQCPSIRGGERMRARGGVNRPNAGRCSRGVPPQQATMAAAARRAPPLAAARPPTGRHAPLDTRPGDLARAWVHMPRVGQAASRARQRMHGACTAATRVHGLGACAQRRRRAGGAPKRTRTEAARGAAAAARPPQNSSTTGSAKQTNRQTYRAPVFHRGQEVVSCGCWGTAPGRRPAPTAQLPAPGRQPGWIGPLPAERWPGRPEPATPTFSAGGVGCWVSEPDM